MITVISRFPLPEGTDDATLTDTFAESVPRYRDIPGLVRKYYYRTEDGRGGGVYLFNDRASAEAVFDAAFRSALEERFGAPVTIEFLTTLIVLETSDGSVTRADKLA